MKHLEPCLPSNIRMLGTRSQQMHRIPANRRSLSITLLLVILPILAAAQAGQLDTTFGTGGIVTTSFTGQDTTLVNCAALQSDGKILVGGEIPDSKGVGVLGLARYNTDGSLDTSFGTGGIVTTTSVNGAAFGIALQSDGKIVVGTAVFLAVDAVRYNTDGTLDTSFGSGGIATVRPFSPNAFDAAPAEWRCNPTGRSWLPPAMPWPASRPRDRWIRVLAVVA
jgi:uncharacterized delta-60 repeat protein